MSRSRKQRKTGNWVSRQSQDVYVRQAREQGLRARSAFKLEQIAKKYRLIGASSRVLDLGCAPGSWCQFAVTQVASHGQVLGVDLLHMEQIEGVEFIQGDFSDPDVRMKILAFFEQSRADLVLSDMAPNITGIRVKDQANAEAMQHGILDLCVDVLKPGGKLLTKLFEGESMNTLRNQFSRGFEQIQMIKPDASRAKSREVYLLGKGFRNLPRTVAEV